MTTELHRKLTDEERQYLGDITEIYCDCDSVGCGLCNFYMPQDEAIENWIKSRVESQKQAEKRRIYLDGLRQRQADGGVLTDKEVDELRTADLYQKLFDSMIKSGLADCKLFTDSNMLKIGDTIRVRRNTMHGDKWS